MGNYLARIIVFLFLIFLTEIHSLYCNDDIIISYELIEEYVDDIVFPYYSKTEKIAKLSNLINKLQYVMIPKKYTHYEDYITIFFHIYNEFKHKNDQNDYHHLIQQLLLADRFIISKYKYTLHKNFLEKKIYSIKKPYILHFIKKTLELLLQEFISYYKNEIEETNDEIIALVNLLEKLNREILKIKDGFFSFFYSDLQALYVVPYEK